ncbi:hypothetical protein K466DRAFT_336123 [Polyporus arcularius HHB13444]|uniref:Uncharacterized protein n=1 Tax=Polyporus arcularius HHB13444 TaxID=1314778 RepID=A0A5C3NWS0_9APHY|nr:hypothetical protein K466DRAFT_336123 [Polyporus arcularius HHB13444]
MAANGHDPTHLACKCLNIRIHAQPTHDTPPPVEAGFKAVYVGEEGIRVAHTEVTLRSRSKAVPDSSSPTAELTRYTTITCLVCGLPTYRVLQRITPDLSAEEGPVLPTDDWVEKELCKSSTGWIEVYPGCLTNKEIAQAESSDMYSQLFHIVLPGGTPPSATEPSEDEHPHPINARGPSEQERKHLPELPPLFLPPPFTPSHTVFSHFAAVATEQSQKLRDQAEEYIAQVTEQKVAEIRKAEATLKQEVNMVWTRFRDSLRLHERPSGKAVPPNRRRSTSVSGHARSLSSPNQGTSASVRISSFVPTPTPSTRTSPSRGPMPSALSASLRTTGMQYPGPASQTNGNGDNSPSRQSPPSPPSERGRASPGRSSTTRVHSLRSTSTASSRTAALATDVETSIREAHRREMDEAKDMATSFRYVMDLEAQMEQQRLQAEAEVESDPAATATESSVTAAARGHSPRVHRSAIKHSAATEAAASPKDKAKDDIGAEEHKGKSKRKVTFDVEPEVAVIDDEPIPPNSNEDVIFDMDNESEHSVGARAEAQQEPPKPAPPRPTQERVRSHPRPSHSRSSSGSALPPQLALLRPASLPAPSTMRPPQRHPTPPSNEAAERSRALREALVAVEAQGARGIESPIEIAPEQSGAGEEPSDPREAELLKLVAASTPSHRSAWKKNSKAWQVFYNRRERRAGQVGPEPISEEGNYVLDDFDPQASHHFNGVPDSDVTDEDGSEDDKWTSTNGHPIAQSVPIPIGPLGQHRQAFGFQPKTSLSDRPGMLVPALRNSTTSASLRRASYAERDMLRPVDPGAFDFTADEDDEDDDDVPSDPETGGKARQRALNILKTRNEIPAAGMWRSLA